MQYEQVGARNCYQVHRGRLMRGANVIVSRCYSTQGPETVADMAGPIVATSSGHAFRILWAQQATSASQHWSTVWTAIPGARRIEVTHQWAACADGQCVPGAPGLQLGPLAARDGVVLYSVANVAAGSSCQPQGKCNEVVTGGVIKHVIYLSNGFPKRLDVHGAPPAALMATAGGVLAEQPLAADGSAEPSIQIRGVDTGTLTATIPVTGTIDSMAMSRSVLALLTTDAQHQHHLLRYSVSTGSLLGSTWLKRGVDPTSLGIYGENIVYQTTRAIRVFRIDLGHAVSVYAQHGYQHNLSIDCYGVRWTTSDQYTQLQPAEIMGVDLPPAH